MADTTLPRDTKKYQSDEVLSCPQKGGTKVLKGTLVVAQAGFARPGTTALGLVALGRAKRTTDNTAGGDGAATVEVETGIFRWANGDSIAAADRWKPAFVVDNQTVAKGAAGKSFAGLIVDVDAQGVWVATFPNMTDLDGVSLAALITELASTDSGEGASTIGVEDDDGHFDGDNVEEVLAELGEMAHAAPAMQAVDATLANGTIAITSGIVVAANSEVVPLVIGDITGSTNFGTLREREASRVAGVAGVGAVTIDAVGANGQLDADAAGAIRVLILTPQ